MPELTSILKIENCEIENSDETISVNISYFEDEYSPYAKIFIEVESSEETYNSNIELELRAENPLFESITILSVATAYALSYASTLAVNVGRLAYKHYDQTSENLDITQKLRVTIVNLKNDKEGIKKCLTSSAYEAIPRIIVPLLV